MVHARLNTAISAEDAEAADVYYHPSCYTKLKNDARAAKSTSSVNPNTPAHQSYDPLVFAQLVAFVQFGQTVVKLSELRKLYEQRLQLLNSEWINTRVQPSRFKEHLLEKLGPDWSAYLDGREIYISHRKTVGAALAETARLHVTDDEAKKIVDVGLMLRKHILLQQMPFDGSFGTNCLSEPVAAPLLILLDTMLEGSNSICNTGWWIVQIDKHIFIVKSLHITVSNGRWLTSTANIYKQYIYIYILCLC